MRLWSVNKAEKYSKICVPWRENVWLAGVGDYTGGARVEEGNREWEGEGGGR